MLYWTACKEVAEYLIPCSTYYNYNNDTDSQRLKVKAPCICTALVLFFMLYSINFAFHHADSLHSRGNLSTTGCYTCSENWPHFYFIKNVILNWSLWENKSTCLPPHHKVRIQGRLKSSGPEAGRALMSCSKKQKHNKSALNLDVLLRMEALNSPCCWRCTHL